MQYCKSYTCMYIASVTGVPDSPVLSYESTLNEILITWLPVSSDTVCGPVTYNVTVMPSHGMVVRMNDTFYNITGLNCNTDYTVTVYASNIAGDGKPTIITVRTHTGMHNIYVYVLTYVYKINIMVICTNKSN